jgi:putative ABC transport system permease protein
MNTMLASVLERTSEIGLRRSVGATRRQIWLQFLVESTIMATAGGLLGIVIGTGGSVAITRYAGWPTAVSVWAVCLAVAVSCLTGVFFGTYPARRAASLDPIDAVRYE